MEEFPYDKILIDHQNKFFKNPTTDLEKRALIFIAERRSFGEWNIFVLIKAHYSVSLEVYSSEWWQISGANMFGHGVNFFLCGGF